MTSSPLPPTEHAPIGVAFIAGRLHVGGAQRQLLYLAQGLDRRRFAPLVIDLRRGDPLTPVFRAAGVETLELGYRGRHDVGIVGRIRRELRRRRIRVVCPYLWPATLWGYLGLRWAGVSRWIASERSNAAPYDSPLAVALESRILARAPVLVAISNAARDFALARGVRPERIRVIPIGVPVPRPAETAARVRAQLGLAPDAPVVGCVARFDPQKDHATLLQAMTHVVERVPRAELVLVGEGKLRSALESLCAEIGLGTRVHFVGMSFNPADFINIFDVAAPGLKPSGRLLHQSHRGGVAGKARRGDPGSGILGKARQERRGSSCLPEDLSRDGRSQRQRPRTRRGPLGSGGRQPRGPGNGFGWLK